MSFPNVAEAFADWTETVLLRIVSKNIVDGQIEEQEKADTEFEAVMQPIPSRKLFVKPEGQRNWNWWTIQTEQYLELDMILEDEFGKQYRVMLSNDWEQAGYYEFEITEKPS